jgi:hypothetical protein
MRRFSFRSILLVLALVVQASAGGNAFAGLSGSVAVSQYCDDGGTGQHQAPAERKHDCLSCPLCAFSALSAPLVGSGPNVLILRPGISLDAEPEFLAPSATKIGRAHQPRAPPARS